MVVVLPIKSPLKVLTTSHTWSSVVESLLYLARFGLL